MRPPAAPRNPARWWHAAAGVGVCILSSCFGDPATTEPPPGGHDVHTSAIVIAGRAERSGSVSVALVVDGDTIPASATVWTFAPVGAATLSGSTLRLNEAGSLSIVAKGNGQQASTSLDVAVPPAIVFDMVVDGNRDIYSASLDGRDLMRLTTSSSDDEYPTSAADNVVFTSYRDGNAELYRMPEHGGTAIRLTTSTANETQPALSADGLKLAYTSDASGVNKLWIASGAATSGAAVSTGIDAPQAVESSPAWSSDGQRIAFMSTSAGGADLYALRVADDERQPLAATSAAEVEPSWSPDGLEVAFTAATGGRGDLCVLNVATGETARLTNGDDSYGEPSWLPDGRILYVAWTSTGSELRWLDPANAATTVAIPLAGRDPLHPSPVGRR